MRWEYRFIQLPAAWFSGLNADASARGIERAEDALDALGEEGWEAVNLMIAGDYNPYTLLKRPSREGPPRSPTV
jgi:hypothetical protein